MKKFFIIFLFLFLYIQAFAEKGIYKAYVYFIPVGEITFNIEENKAFVIGKTYEGLRWLYNYTFRFEASSDGYFLYENENGKEKVYKNQEIMKKKSWLPLIVKYILEGKKPDPEKDKSFPYKIVEEKNQIVIYPLKSKKVKKILITQSTKSRLPEKIKIYGKVRITLEKIK